MCRPRPLIRGDPTGVVDTVRDRLPCGCLWSDTEPFYTVHGGWDGRGSRRRTCAAGRKHARHARQSARKRLKEKARKGRRAAEAAGEPEVAPSPAPPPVFKTLREKKAAQASAEGWAAEVARAEELYEELRERAPQHCRRGGKWAREKFVMAVQGEFPRARGAGVPKGTILCLGRVLDAHDEQDDAEGGHRDWEEDPLGFDTNPMLLRAMCMAFE